MAQLRYYIRLGALDRSKGPSPWWPEKVEVESHVLRRRKEKQNNQVRQYLLKYTHGQEG